MKTSLLFVALIVSATAAASAATRPNVVFIAADDPGWSDTTLYGTTKLFQTPNTAPPPTRVDAR